MSTQSPTRTGLGMATMMITGGRIGTIIGRRGAVGIGLLVRSADAGQTLARERGRG